MRSRRQDLEEDSGTALEAGAERSLGVDLSVSEDDAQDGLAHSETALYERTSEEEPEVE